MSNLRFWAKNDGAKVKVCQNGAFLEHFLQILGHFLQKTARFLQKSREIERFLTIMKKAPSFSRCSERWPISRRKIRTYGNNAGLIIRTYERVKTTKDTKAMKVF